MPDEELLMILEHMEDDSDSFYRWWMEVGEQWFMSCGGDIIRELLAERAKGPTIRR